jgi:hypothetical protein
MSDMCSIHTLSNTYQIFLSSMCSVPMI